MTRSQVHRYNPSCCGNQNPSNMFYRNRFWNSRSDACGDGDAERPPPSCRSMKNSLVAARADWRMTFAVFLVVLGMGHLGTAAPHDYEHNLRAERELLANQWAPIVWLHPDEHFYPSSVIYFLQHVKPSKPESADIITINEAGSQITLPSLPTGRSSWDTYLLASYNRDCHNCRLPKFLYGKKPGRKYSPPSYAVIHSCSFLEHKRRDSTNSYYNYQEFQNDGHLASSENLSTKTTDLPSLLSQSHSASLEHVIKPNTKDSRPPTTNTTSFPQNNHQQQPSTQSQNNSSYESYSKDELAYAPKPTTVNSFESLTSTLLTTINTNINEKRENKVNSTTAKPLIKDTTDNYGILVDTNVQNDQDPYSKQNTIIVIDLGKENYKTYVKEKKRDVIYNSHQVFSVTYWMFYPYNYAKDICTANLGFFGRIPKPTINGVCYGEKIAMGNHVGDWEHLTIQFKGRTPTKMYVSSHNFGAYYAYDPNHNVFHYISQDTRKGVPLSPEYSRILKLQGTHPILYAALGSHGLWPTPGVHQYNNFPSLEDKTGEGTAWHTSQNLEIMDLQHKETFTPSQRHWFSYEGRWGNPSSNCHALMGGFCEINHGPTGIPRKRVNFPC